MPEQQQNLTNTQRRLRDLLSFPREGLDIELKNWLDLSLEIDKANLAQAILALANFGGGYILIGFAESKGIWIPIEQRPEHLDFYTQDIINGVVERYADPPFHCEVYHEQHPQNGDIFPVIVVPGDHSIPIRAKRDGPNHQHVRQNTYYIRAAGPSSRPIKSAREWDELIGRCVRAKKEELIGDIKDILLGIGPKTGPTSKEEQEKKKLENWFKDSGERWKALVSNKLSQGKPSHYSLGIWTVAYSIEEKFKSPSLNNFLEILRKVKGHETGWPPWLIPTKKEISPYPFNGLIECWMIDTILSDPAHSDFWRASPKGMMYLLRGYQEDSSPDRLKPGTILDLTLPVWRVGECLLHASRLATALISDSAKILFQVTWEGLAGRTLASWANPKRSLSEDRQSNQEKVTSDIKVEAGSIVPALPEIVKTLTSPLYEVFEFFVPPSNMFKEELAEMLRRKNKLTSLFL